MTDRKLDKQKAIKIIRCGLEKLGDADTQVQLQQHLAKNGYEFSIANLNKIYRKYYKVQDSAAAEDIQIGRVSLLKFAEGLLVILKKVNLEYNMESDLFEATDFPDHLSIAHRYKPRFFAEGRRSIADKIQFIQNAKEEVIEMGIRLNTFSKYFIGRSDSEFKNHIIELLKKGVTFKCLMMQPTAEITKIYFADRAKVDPREITSFNEMPQILEDLKQIRDDLNALKLPGTMKIYLYDNFPYQHYLVVDGDDEHGKMLYSSYIYGEKRANCPVTEVYRYGSLDLYQRHWKSLQAIFANAIEV